MDVVGQAVPHRGASKAGWRVGCDVATLSGGAEAVLPPEKVRPKTAAPFNRRGSPEHSEMAREFALRVIRNQGPDWRA